MRHYTGSLSLRLLDLHFPGEKTEALWVWGHGNSLRLTPVCVAAKPMPSSGYPGTSWSPQAPASSDSVIPLESRRGSRLTLLSQTQSVLLFASSWSFFTFHDCRPSGCQVPSHVLFYVHWVLVIFNTSTDSPVSFPLSFLPALNKKLCTNQRARKLSWPVEYINLFLCWNYELPLEVCPEPLPLIVCVHDHIRHSV